MKITTASRSLSSSFYGLLVVTYAFNPECCEGLFEVFIHHASVAQVFGFA
jgi:hypothetical protein